MIQEFESTKEEMGPQTVEYITEVNEVREQIIISGYSAKDAIEILFAYQKNKHQEDEP